MRGGQENQTEKKAMKKFLMLALAALAVTGVCRQPAWAFKDDRFSVGLNLDWRGGGTNFLWGAWRSEEPPPVGYAGYPAYPGGYSGFGPTLGEASGAAGSNGGHATPAPSAGQPAPVQPTDYQPSYFDQTGLIPVGYYPYAGYGYYPMSYYWYGR
jgi:hypothetical protein